MSKHGDAIIKLTADLDRTRKELELNKKLLARQCDMAREAETKREKLQKKYYDLIMAVANKYPNETRHETAKRYIMEANTEKVSTKSVTQPKIDFCHACGTALGVE